MKKIGYILFFTAAFASCETVEEADQWNQADLFISQHADFDPAAVPALLTDNTLLTYRRFDMTNKEVIYTDHWVGEAPDGCNSSEYLFFGDGTCWMCWMDISGAVNGGIYAPLKWNYDPQTRSLFTGFDQLNYEATVKAVGDNMMVIDGCFFDSFMRRYVLKFDPDPAIRSNYMENYNNYFDIFK